MRARPPAFPLFAAFLPALIFVATFLGVALARMAYPFELEWMEGGTWLHAKRLAGGLALYPPPGLEFTPFLYPPLYFLVASWLEPLGLLGIPAMRCISWLATVAALGLLGRWVWRETRSAAAAAAAVGAYAASFAQSGFFFDLARVDALWMALLLGFAYALRFSTAPRGHVLAAVLAVAAAFTKQQSLGLMAALALAAGLRNRKQGLIFAAVAGGLLTALFLLLQWRTGGWFGYYAWTLPAHHAWEKEAALGFWLRDLGWRQAFPFCAMVAVALKFKPTHDSVAAGRPNPNRPLNLTPNPIPSTPNPQPPTLFYPLLFATLFAIAWSSRLHTGGYLNVLMPAHAALALACGLAWPRVAAFISGNSHAAIRFAAMAAPIGVWISWAYNPLSQIPSRGDREAGKALVERLKSDPEPVWIPNHPYLAQMVGKQPMAHRMALEDVLRVNHSAGDALRLQIRHAIERNSFSVIYLSAPDPEEEAVLPKSFRSHYSLQDSVFQGERLFRPRTGMKLRPQYRFIPRPDGL